MTEQTAESDNPSALRKIGRLRLVSAAAAIGILIVLAGVYGIEHSAKQSGRCRLPAGG